MRLDHALAQDPAEILAHGPFLTAIARALLRDEHAAEDAVQDTWVRALERSPDGVDHPRGWLRAVTSNFARKFARGESRRRAREEHVARGEATDSTADVVQRESVREAVLSAVLELDEPYRATILARFYDDLPPREVSRRHGVPVETVRTRTRRGLAKLRGRLDERYGDRAAWSALLVPVAAKAPWAAGGALLAAGTKLGLAFAAVVVAVLVWRVSTGGGAPEVPVADGPVLAARAEEVDLDPTRLRTPAAAAVAATPGARALEGVVLDVEGRPVEGAAVVVAPETGIEPKFVLTGGDGRFRFGVSPDVDAADLEVNRLHNDWFLLPESSRTVTDFTEPVELLVGVAPRASVELAVVETPSGRRPASFEAWLWRVDTKNYHPVSSPDGAPVRFQIPLHPTRPSTSFMARQGDGTGMGTPVELRPGEHRRIVIEVPRDEVVVEVVDAGGAPVADALVYFGGPVDLRGDEPFKSSRPERIRGGARTDAQGLCTLVGSGPFVSVFHPDHSTATVEFERSARVTLSPRGAIAGSVLDRTGAPLVGATVTLDRAREARTDADGRFLFEGVEAGVRGLQVPDSGVFAWFVEVRGGETSEVVLGAPDAAVTVDVGGPVEGDAVVLSLEPFGSVVPLPEAEPRVASGLIGREQLLVSRGRVARGAVTDGALSFDEGTATLVVEAGAGTRVFVAPAGVHELAELLCQRLGTRTVPGSGEVRFERLAPGEWRVGVDRVGLLESVVLSPGEESRTAIPD